MIGPRSKLWIRRAAILSLVVGVVGLAAAWHVAGELVAPSPRRVGRVPSGLNATAFTLESSSGDRLAGWHLRPEGGSGVVVLVHGIRGSRLSMMGRACMLYREGFACVLFDLRAHGESTGDSITVGDLERHDVAAAVAFARAEHPGQKVAVLGVSLGGAAAVLASPLAIDALVLESVFPDIESAVKNRVAAQLGALSDLPAALLLMQMGPRFGLDAGALRPLDRIHEVGCPVCILSGVEDRHTTAEEARALFAAASRPKELWLVPGAGHVDLRAAAPEDYAARVTGFLRRHLR